MSASGGVTLASRSARAASPCGAHRARRCPGARSRSHRVRTTRPRSGRRPVTRPGRRSHRPPAHRAARSSPARRVRRHGRTRRPAPPVLHRSARAPTPYPTSSTSAGDDVEGGEDLDELQLRAVLGRQVDRELHRLRGADPSRPCRRGSARASPTGGACAQARTTWRTSFMYPSAAMVASSGVWPASRASRYGGIPVPPVVRRRRLLEGIVVIGRLVEELGERRYVDRLIGPGAGS